jgi:2-polyprenyl-3-methyl-5-hydroxy-6-metoxy-1,4-benzoquinol methylase
MIFSNSDQIIKYFSEKNIDDNSMRYLKTHAKRYACMLHEIREIRYNIKNKHIVSLDIGESFFTELYRVEFNEDNLYTLGLSYEKYRGGHLPIEINRNEKFHYHFNLNNLQYADNLSKKIPKFDIIIMAEVIEHLYTAPEIILSFIKKITKQDGYIFVLTPNAASLSKRMKLMFKGENPYEMIRINHCNPGHYREYTSNELYNLFKKLSFEICKIDHTNYVKFNSKKGHVEKFLRSIFHHRLRRYIFAIIKNK